MTQLTTQQLEKESLKSMETQAEKEEKEEDFLLLKALADLMGPGKLRALQRAFRNVDIAAVEEDVGDVVGESSVATEATEPEKPITFFLKAKQELGDYFELKEIAKSKLHIDNFDVIKDELRKYSPTSDSTSTPKSFVEQMVTRSRGKPEVNYGNADGKPTFNVHKKKKGKGKDIDNGNDCISNSN